MGTSESYTFSELLKQFRVRSGLSQEELGKKLSVHRNTISAWERGLNLPETRGMVLELAKALDLEAGDEDADQLLKSALFDVPSPVWNLPYTRNSFFTGREETLRRLYETLIMTKKAALTQAISGLGGVGKTQIAVEYAYLYRDEYRAVLWVRADSPESLTLDFIALAHLLHLPEKNAQDQITIVGAVKNWLSTHNKWLLIFDNADSAKIISEFLPPAGNGHVLLTTQAQAQGPSAQSIEVGYMGLTEGTLFLLRRAKALPPETSLDQTSATERTAAEEIVQILGGLPLALDQAAAYIEETGCGISDYLDRFRTQHDKLQLRRGRLVIDHPESVTATFLLSFEKVRQVNPAAAQLLKLCAFLYPDAIPEELISEGTHKLDPGLQALAGDHFALDEAMEALRSYSLIRRNPSTKIFFIHRLVQEVLRDTMDMKEQRQWAERVVRTLNRVFPDPEKIEAWPLCQRYLPQAQACVNLINRWGLKIWEGTQLLNQVGYYLQHAHALYSEAEALYALALSIDILTFGPEHPKVSLLLNNLAEIYRIQGKYSQAEPLYHQSLALRAQHFGHNHPGVADALNNLGTFYGDQGKYDKAELYHQQALAIRKEILDPNHWDLAVSLNNLADIYRMQERYDKAEALYLEALEISKRVFGDEHLHVATILNNLAVLYSTQKKYNEAEPFCKESLSITEQTLGPNHPDTAISLIGLADIHLQQGSYDQAEASIRKSLLIFEKTLGAKHFYTAQSLHNLGWLYYVQSKYTQAEASYQQALTLYRQYPELEYPHLAESLQKLADLYNAQERYEEAEALFEQALTIIEQALGPDHPRTAQGYHNLGWLCYQQKKYDKAEHLLQHAFSILEKTSGSEHPDVAICLDHLAALNRDQGKYAEAEPLYKRALYIREQVLGSSHLDTAKLLNNLALLYYKQGNLTDAEPLYRRALAISEQALGSEQPEIAICLHNLALLYEAKDEYGEAEKFYQRALYIREQTLGPEHSGVSKVLENYSILLRKMGRESDATRLKRRPKMSQVKDHSLKGERGENLELS